jgi:hypothetical protein
MTKRLRIVEKVFIAITAISFAGASAFARTINIWTGGTPRGGYGDIASNLIMARRLKEVDPKAKINLLISKDALEGVQILWPTVKSIPSTRQNIYGINLYHVGVDKLPHADFVLAFSRPRGFVTSGEEPLIGKTGDIFLSFSEYRGSLGPNPAAADYVDMVRFDPKTLRPHLTLSSGIRSTGLYISPQKKLPKISKDELGRQIDQSGLTQKKLAFAYSHEIKTLQPYIEAMKAIAKSSRYESEEILLYIKEHRSLEVSDLPKNLKVVEYKSIPFELSEAMIAHSDFPPLVTGDVSLGLAIDYGKIPIYECFTWKRDHIRNVADVIAGAAKTDPDTLAPIFLNRAELDSGTIAKFILDQELQNKLTTALDNLRSKISLPINLLQMMSALEEIDFNRLKKLNVPPADLAFNAWPSLLNDAVSEPSSMKRWKKLKKNFENKDYYKTSRVSQILIDLKNETIVENHIREQLKSHCESLLQ